MHRKFSEVIESLHTSYERLIALAPSSEGKLPRNMPLSGVYLFSENGKPLYVGRSRNMRRRYGLHTRPSAQHNQASFAFLLARESLGMTCASYKPGKTSRVGLSENSDFVREFKQAKSRIRSMDYRFVEETEATRQALLEIYCSVSLGTPYNDFCTH